MFIQTTKDTTEEEYEIVKDATRALENMHTWKMLEKSRSHFIESIKRAIMLKFPLINHIGITHNSISVQTELHSQHFCIYDLSVPKPEFKCDIQVKDMPDNAEDYLKMRANIIEDRKQIMTAMNYIYFRYDIKAK